MATSLLETTEIETGPHPTAAIVILHGIGADGHYFEPFLKHLVPSDVGPLRLVFPNAPLRAITLCGGERMRAWYDLRNTDRRIAQDEQAVRASGAAISALVEREEQRGMRSERIVLAGFSQGGAMALFTGTRYPRRLAGIVALSCYPLLPESFAIERQPTDQQAPVFLAHGQQDPVIDQQLGELARGQLQDAGYRVEWHVYPIGHELNAAELAAAASFLQRALGVVRALSN